MTDPTPYDQYRDDRDPPEFPDVDENGDERETTGLDEHGDPLSQAEIDCDPNTDTDDLNHRYDPVDE